MEAVWHFWRQSKKNARRNQIRQGLEAAEIVNGGKIVDSAFRSHLPGLSVVHRQGSSLIGQDRRNMRLAGDFQMYSEIPQNQ